MFTITEEQIEKVDRWKVEHDKVCKYTDPMNQGTIGVRFTYCFTTTSLGVIIIVKCSCGVRIDLSDYEGW